VRFPPGDSPRIPQITALPVYPRLALVETLIVGAFYAVAQRVEAQWLDDFASTVNDQLRGLIGKLAKAIRADKASGTAEPSQATQNVLEELDHQVKTDLASAEQLTNPPLPAKKSATRIQQIADFLNYEGELIAGLRRPVALPGFFNSASCVTVIEVRPTWSSAGPLVMPEPSGRAGDPADKVLSFRYGSPLIWLIKTADDARRDEIAKDFNDSARRDKPSAEVVEKMFKRPFPSFFGEKSPAPATTWSPLVAGERAQRLETIDRDRVTVDTWDSLVDKSWYTIEDPQGIVLFRAALAALVEEEQIRAGLWPTALGISPN
jgi:hypothetical protein